MTCRYKAEPPPVLLPSALAWQLPAAVDVLVLQHHKCKLTNSTYCWRPRL